MKSILLALAFCLPAGVVVAQPYAAPYVQPYPQPVYPVYPTPPIPAGEWRPAYEPRPLMRLLYGPVFYIWVPAQGSPR